MYTLHRPFRVGMLLGSMLLLGLFLSSSVATAAGPPTVAVSSVKGSLTTINGETLKAIMKSNGAPTTYKLEYGLTTSLGTTLEGTVGGEEEVVSRDLSGVLPNTKYRYRFTATNSFGTTQTPIYAFNTNRWVGSGITWPSSYVSSGSFTFEIPAKVAVITCSESGSGQIGGGSGSDSVTMNFSKCSVAKAPQCNVEPFTMNLDGGLNASLTYLNITGAECGFAYKIGLSPILTNSYNVPFEAAPSYTFAGSFKYGAWNGYIKGTSTWQLSGANIGKAFRWMRLEE